MQLTNGLFQTNKSQVIHLKKERKNMQPTWQLTLMLVPAAIALLLFNYFPMYGIAIAFQRFEPLKGFANSEWVGFLHFERLFSRNDFYQILRNTVLIALGKMLLGQIFSVIFALFLNEVRVTFFKRTVQTLSYLPYFLSWMIFGGMLRDMLGKEGLVNQVLGMLDIPAVAFLSKTAIFPWTMIATDILKGFGWGAIIYLAAMTAIDQNLYEAAAVDGANRFQGMLHITLPGIITTIVIVFTLNLGYVLSAGFDQIFVMYNPVVYKTGDIIDTWVYRTGIEGSQYSLATAVGLFKSVVGMVLISGSYYFARRFANYRMF
jgi:putative aldouronate transport system permease protein